MDYQPELCEQHYNARAAVPSHPQIIARWAAQSSELRRSAPCHIDLEYGSGAREKLDIFPAEGRSRAMLVFIHGGYWRSLDRSDFSFLTSSFTRQGVTMALPGYSLCPQARLDDIVQQVRAAIAWLWRNSYRYSADAHNLFVAGHSAGGHLAAMMAATHWPSYATYLPLDLVKGAIPISGLYELEPLLHTSINNDVRLDLDAAKRLSPALMLPPTKAPIITAVGGAETEGFKRQNALLAKRWADHASMTDVALPGFDHFTVVEQLSEVESPLHQAAMRLVA
jgi:arylformamidase